jgi:excisionase family DNA binding protein
MHDDSMIADMLAGGFDRVADVAATLSLSRSQVYRLIDSGVLPAVRVGSARRVPRRAVRDLLVRQLEAGLARREGEGC